MKKYIGKNVPRDITEEHLKKLFPRLRIFTPNLRIGTDDFISTRMNIHLDENGNIIQMDRG